MVPATQHEFACSLQHQHPAGSQVAVLLVTHEFGGHEKMLLEWLKVVQRDIQIDIYCRNIPELPQQCGAAGLHADTFAYAIPSRRWRIFKTFDDLLKTLRIIRRMPADAVVLFAPGVVQTEPWHILAAALCRRRVASYVPMAYGSRDMRFRFAALRDWFARQVSRHVDLWITITEQQRRLLQGRWLVRAPIYVVPNRLQLPGTTAMVGPTQTEEHRSTRVLFLGRFEHNQKGLDWLVAELRRHRPLWVGRMRFVFQGQGEYEQQLRRLAVETAGDSVSVAPWGDGTQAIQQADVLLLPSRFEGFPLVAVEATHYGVPVVASNEAGLADVLPQECLFPFGDFEAMIRSIEHMRDSGARVSAVAHARARMQLLLSKDRFEQAVAHVIREFAGDIAGAQDSSATP